MQNENSILLALKRIPWNKGKLPTGTFETLEDGTMIARKHPCTCEAVEAIPEDPIPVHDLRLSWRAIMSVTDASEEYGPFVSFLSP